ncbi:DUF4382 domain-containing protein [Thalassotalea mangrovi]|uniref:DUF4382 domain-containing protein n=1 Tax=Thalassotalea mangrovi TaxID=2572245 RepID=A0A4U1B5L4_9GAMM|nr:DUF4382 domain-containing protein [Thalassotalea mangrovi]TKB45744.1 DUF4382 domain-containing protein [Thalassotalea mangrovi]
MFFSKTKTALAVALSATLTLAGCGSDSDSPSTFSLAISDAPVDGLSNVTLCFNRVELNGEGGKTEFIVGEHAEMINANSECPDATNSVGINLLEYTGAEALTLINNIEIDAGKYNQMRFVLSEGSFAIKDAQYDEDGNEVAAEQRVPVVVPSNELKLDGFTVAQGGNVSFTLEFDLRKGMTNPVGQENYFVKPRGVRLVDNNLIGHLEGTVAEMDYSCTQMSPEDTSLPVGSVYIYNGADQTALGDNTATDVAEETQPLASAGVFFNENTNMYEYAIGFLLAGDYTVAFTCDTEDDPELDEELDFVEQQNVTIFENETTVADFSKN